MANTANTAIVETILDGESSNGNIRQFTLTVKDTVSNTEVISYAVLIKDGVII